MAASPSSPPLVRRRAETAQDFLRQVREARFQDGMSCPRCGGRRIHHWGSFSGRQRYRCLHCGRTFSDLTGTPMAYSKRVHLWPEHWDCVSEPLTVRAVAARLGIHRDTAWRWRHRVLAALKRSERAVLLWGLVEVGEAWFLHSEKGSRTLRRPPYTRPRPSVAWSLDRPRVSVMLARDERGGSLSELIGAHRARADDVRDLLLPRCAPGVVLASLDGPASAYRTAITGLEQRWTRTGTALLRHPRARFGARVFRIRRWLRPFRGVATRYLVRYLTWHDALERLSDASVPPVGGTRGVELLRRAVRPTIPADRGRLRARPITLRPAPDGHHAPTHRISPGPRVSPVPAS